MLSKQIAQLNFHSVGPCHAVGGVGELRKLYRRGASLLQMLDDGRQPFTLLRRASVLLVGGRYYLQLEIIIYIWKLLFTYGNYHLPA